MKTTLLIRDEDVIPQLTGMGLTRPALRDILLKTAGERANVSPLEPPPVMNYEAWRWGTRFIRECDEFKETGYTLCDHDQIYGVRNDELRLKLVFCNTNNKTGVADPNVCPKNTTVKGPNTCELIGLNSPQTEFNFIKRAFNRGVSDYALWLLCAFFDENGVRAELSRPQSENGGIINSWSDRIIIAGPGELPFSGRSKNVPEEFADVPAPIVKRK